MNWLRLPLLPGGASSGRLKQPILCPIFIKILKMVSMSCLLGVCYVLGTVLDGESLYLNFLHPNSSETIPA